jgi:peptidylprolyl isomerase
MRRVKALTLDNRRLLSPALAGCGGGSDSSWSRNEPFSFTLGAGEVIPGWDQGVEGMKVGGRRELIIPPEPAYGEAGAPPAIGPNETLVFVIDPLEVG